MIKTEHREELRFFKREDEKGILHRNGCEKIDGKSYVRFVKWNSKKRKYVLEALILYGSKLFYKTIKENER